MCWNGCKAFPNSMPCFFSLSEKRLFECVSELVSWEDIMAYFLLAFMELDGCVAKAHNGARKKNDIIKMQKSARTRFRVLEIALWLKPGFRWGLSIGKHQDAKES
jgi:hypothetical protein